MQMMYNCMLHTNILNQGAKCLPSLEARNYVAIFVHAIGALKDTATQFRLPSRLNFLTNIIGKTQYYLQQMLQL